MINHAAQMGMDMAQTQMFLDQCGICEEDPFWLNYMQAQGYVNKLRF